MTTDEKIESRYAKRVSIEHRKRFGQFFTPENIAELMCGWILGTKYLREVLDPAFGLGVFARVLRRHNQDVAIRGFEIDEQILNAAKEYSGVDAQTELCLKDYIYSDWSGKFDGIVCNPPYFKFHDFDNKKAVAEIERKLGISLSGFTNLYALFILKSVHQLAENGRCAYIVPSEFLNADYGVRIKDFLVKSGMLRHIFVFDFTENVFDDALTTSCILLFANDNNRDTVCFHNIRTAGDLAKISATTSSYPETPSADAVVPAAKLDPSIKWKKYYQKRNGKEYRNLVPFSNYAKVVRGIATGANDYFTFTLEKAHEYGIPERCLMPCVCHSTDIDGLIFDSTDFERLKNSGKKVFLINMTASDSDRNVRKYIAKGEQEGVDKKHLTSCRKPWYSIEKRKPAPIWVSVFNRSGLRFVRNESGISNLTTFHCVYPNESLFNTVSRELLFAYLITDTAKAIFEDNAREYGNGLQKFEPNDLNKGMMLDLAMLPEDAKEQIVALYLRHRESRDVSFIQKIDQLFRDNFKADRNQPQLSSSI